MQRPDALVELRPVRKRDREEKGHPALYLVLQMSGMGMYVLTGLDKEGPELGQRPGPHRGPGLRERWSLLTGWIERETVPAHSGV